MFEYKWESYHVEKNEVVIFYSVLDNDFIVHSHDFCELVIILDGEGSHVIEDKCYPLKKGDVYVITGDISHGYKDMKKLTLTSILFHPEAILLEEIRKDLKGYRAMFEIEPRYRIENDFRAKLTLETYQMNEVTKIIDEILFRSEERSPENRVIIQSLVNLLVSRLSSYYSSKKEHKPRQMLQLSGLLDYIEKNLSNDFDIDALAKMSNFSVRHFNRLFRSIFGVTPTQYIMDRRLSLACQLLCETDLTVTELSAKCGYDDRSYFARIFYKKFNLTPKEYRKSNTAS